nr:cytidylate kinase-like family protein [uncultured Prevotella sp.]
MDKKIIINVGRQVCAGGLEIGKLLAEEFNAKYYDRELLNLAAKESGFSEEFFEQSDERKGFLRSFFHLPYSNNWGAGSNFYQNNFSQESLFKFQSDAIIKAAQESSCVFVGRCADYVLRDFDNVVNVFITSSIESRAKLFMKEKNVSYDEAVKRILQIESRRASYYNYYTGKQWGHASSYDLCIDSSAIGSAETARLIAEFVRKKLKL